MGNNVSASPAQRHDQVPLGVSLPGELEKEPYAEFPHALLTVVREEADSRELIISLPSSQLLDAKPFVDAWKIMIDAVNQIYPLIEDDDETTARFSVPEDQTVESVTEEVILLMATLTYLPKYTASGVTIFVQEDEMLEDLSKSDRLEQEEDDEIPFFPFAQQARKLGVTVYEWRRVEDTKK